MLLNIVWSNGPNIPHGLVLLMSMLLTIERAKLLRIWSYMFGTITIGTILVGEGKLQTIIQML